MSKLKFISIDSFSDNDINDMFVEICAEVIVKPQQEVREMFGFRPVRKINIMELLEVIKKFDIQVKFNMEISYVDDIRPYDERKIAKPIPNFNTGLKESDVHKNLLDQKNEITKPELKDVATIKSIDSSEIKKNPIDPSEIPDIKF